MSRFDPSLLQRALMFAGARPASGWQDTQPAPEDDGTLALRIAKALIRRFEGLYLRPYLCPAGVPSIAYGATFYEDGTRVTLRDPPITAERAEALLEWHVLHVYLPAVRRLCPAVDTPQRLAALIDFCFNLGASRLSASTLRRRVNAKDWTGVPPELRKWVRGGGRVLKGLVLRREAEAALIPRGGGA